MGKYSVIVEKNAQKELKAHYKSGDKALIAKIARIFDELSQHPKKGTGKPELLKYQLAGMWSRRINRGDRIVYEIVDDIVIVHSAAGHYE